MIQTEPSYITQNNVEHNTHKTEINALINQSRHEIPVLTPEIMQAVEDFDEISSEPENPKSVLGEMTDIVGVFAGVKPASLIEMSGDITRNDQLRDSVIRMGLTIREFNSSQGVLLAAVSRNPELADALKYERANNFNMDDNAQQYRIGALLGYPKTSTDHFLHRIKIQRDTGEWPEVEIKGKRAYSQFITSPEHYQQELQQLSEPLEESVKIITPKLHQRLEEVYADDQNKRSGLMTRIIHKMRIRSQ